MSVDVVTFGCRLNIVESEVIRRVGAMAHRRGRGQHLRGDGGSRAPGEADDPPHQARAARARASSSPAARRNPRRKLSPPCRKSPACSATRKSSTRGRGRRRSARRRRRHHGGADDGAAPRSTRLPGHTRAFVQVQNGCDHRCTFCIIPFGRGNSRSLPVDDVVAQVRALCRRRLSRSGAHRRRYHQLWRAASARLGALVKRILSDVPEIARLAPFVDRFGGSRRRSHRRAGQRAAADAASASVVAGGRRPDPQAHEAAAFARRRDCVLR